MLLCPISWYSVVSNSTFWACFVLSVLVWKSNSGSRKGNKKPKKHQIRLLLEKNCRFYDQNKLVTQLSKTFKKENNIEFKSIFFNNVCFEDRRASFIVPNLYFLKNVARDTTIFWEAFWLVDFVFYSFRIGCAILLSKKIT